MASRGAVEQCHLLLASHCARGPADGASRGESHRGRVRLADLYHLLREGVTDPQLAGRVPSAIGARAALVARRTGTAN